MKKYIIKKRGWKRTDCYARVHSSYNEAAKTLMDYLNANNDCLSLKDDDYLTPFDFTIEEVECTEVNEVITSFDSARKALGIKPNTDFFVVKRKLSGKVAQFEDVARLVTDINPKHLEALIALNELFTIAEAWNKEDGFVPDFSNRNQWKYFIWFKYDEDTAKFVCAATNGTPTSAYIGSRLCFKTSERAAQFGKQFVNLFNKVFL